MEKKYSASAFLKPQDSKLYAIFAWSQKDPEIILAQSWLAILEIFIFKNYRKNAYIIFQSVRESYLHEETMTELITHQELIQNSPETLIFLSNESIKNFLQGFRSFIEKSGEIELRKLSIGNNQVLLQLFRKYQLKQD